MKSSAVETCRREVSRGVFVGAIAAGFAGNFADIAIAQEQLSITFGAEDGERFGRSLSRFEDIDGDGLLDFLVGGSGSTRNGPSSGVIRAVSSSTGAIAWEMFGGAGESLGLCEAVGDADGDGFDDFVTTSSNPVGGQPNGNGVILYSGQTRTPIYTRLGAAGEFLGSNLALLGDIDGDNVSDFLARALSPMSVHVVSGRTGSDIYVLSKPAHAIDFGSFLASGSDVDGDGVADFIVDDPTYKLNHQLIGSVWVHSGATGALLFQISGSIDGANFGAASAFVFDVNQDGVDDVAVGAPSEVVGWGDEGAVHVFSGKDGSSLFDVVPPLQNSTRLGFGWYVANLGDTNSDGFGDFAVSQKAGGQFDDPLDPTSKVTFFSGRDRQPIYHYLDFVRRANFTSAFGYQVHDISDVDFDGIPDVLVAAPEDFDATGNSAGSVSVWRCDDFFVDALPRRPAVSSGTLTLSIGQGVAGAPALLYLTTINAAPVNLLLSAFLLDPAGRFVLSGTIPPGLSGYSFGFKAFTLGAANKIVDSGTETVSIQ